MNYTAIKTLGNSECDLFQPWLALDLSGAIITFCFSDSVYFYFTERKIQEEKRKYFGPISFDDFRALGSFLWGRTHESQYAYNLEATIIN